MKRKIVASLMLSALLAGAAQAEDGTVTFTGTIEDGTCAIATDSQAIDVDFGSVSNLTVDNSNGQTNRKHFVIKLNDCPTAVSNAAFSWSGEHSSTDSSSLTLYVNGVTATTNNLNWQIIPGDIDTTSSAVKMDGTPMAAIPVTAGNNEIDYIGSLSGSGGPLPEGEYTGDATYSVTYN